MVEIKPEVLRWVALYIQVVEAPEKRKAMHPPMQTASGPAFYNSAKKCYIVRSESSDGKAAFLKLKVDSDVSTDSLPSPSPLASDSQSPMASPSSNTFDSQHATCESSSRQTVVQRQKRSLGA
eukprot:9298119-Pyramimonas_sp.AAC.1